MTALEKNNLLNLTTEKFLETLGSGIGTGSVFLPFIYNFKQYPQYASMQAIDIFQENPVKFQK